MKKAVTMFLSVMLIISTLLIFTPTTQATNPNPNANPNSGRNNGHNGESSDSNSKDFVNLNQDQDQDLDILGPDDIFIDVDEIMDDSPNSPDILGPDEEVIGPGDEIIDESQGEGFILSRERNNQGRIQYAGNGHTGGTVPAAHTLSVPGSATLRQPGTMVRSGHTFAGWRSSSSGNVFAAGATVIFSNPGTVTYSAVWTSNSNQGTIQYAGGNHTSGTVPSTHTLSVPGSATLRQPGNLARTGHTFAGWRSSSSGNVFAAGATVTFSNPGTVTYTAVWTANNASGTIAYAGNGHTSGSVPASHGAPIGVPTALRSPGTMARSGHVFAGWRSSSSGNIFQPGETVTFSTTATTTYSAVWQPVSTNPNNFVWHSDSDVVRIYSGTPVMQLRRVFEDQSRGFTRTAVEGWLRDASNSWGAEVPNRFVPGATGTAQIEVFAGRPSQLEALHGRSMLGSNGRAVNGLAVSWVDSAYTVVHVIGGRRREVRRMTRSRIYIVDKLNSGGTYRGSEFSARSLTGQRNTTMHEVGHALGFAGHSPNSADVMRTTTSNTDRMWPTARDRIHLRQFLNFHTRSFFDLDIGIYDLDIDIHHDHSHHHDESILTIDKRLETIRNSTRFIDNVIVGTPIKKVQGASEILPFGHEDCEVLDTDYYFRITSWVFGVPGEEIIRVRSQVGHVFEIGKEYTFSAIHINSVHFNQYNVVSHSWFIDHDEISETELNGLHNRLGMIRTLPREREEVFESAKPSIEFMENIDVAIVATIIATEQWELDNENFDAILNLRDVLYGEVGENAFNEFIRLRGDITIGNDYLILFRYDQYGHLMLVAREGAVISYNSIEFHQFNEAINTLSNQESY